jgi:hypothetical protein
LGPPQLDGGGPEQAHGELLGELEGRDRMIPRRRPAGAGPVKHVRGPPQQILRLRPQRQRQFTALLGRGDLLRHRRKPAE